MPILAAPPPPAPDGTGTVFFAPPPNPFENMSEDQLRKRCYNLLHFAAAGSIYNPDGIEPPRAGELRAINIELTRRGLPIVFPETLADGNSIKGNAMPSGTPVDLVLPGGLAGNWKAGCYSDGFSQYVYRNQKYNLLSTHGLNEDGSAVTSIEGRLRFRAESLVTNTTSAAHYSADGLPPTRSGELKAINTYLAANGLPIYFPAVNPDGQTLMGNALEPGTTVASILPDIPWRARIKSKGFSAYIYINRLYDLITTNGSDENGNPIVRNTQILRLHINEILSRDRSNSGSDNRATEIKAINTYLASKGSPIVFPGVAADGVTLSSSSMPAGTPITALLPDGDWRTPINSSGFSNHIYITGHYDWIALHGLNADGSAITQPEKIITTRIRSLVSDPDYTPCYSPDGSAPTIAKDIKSLNTWRVMHGFEPTRPRAATLTRHNITLDDILPDVSSLEDLARQEAEINRLIKAQEDLIRNYNPSRDPADTARIRVAEGEIDRLRGLLTDIAEQRMAFNRYVESPEATRRNANTPDANDASDTESQMTARGRGTDVYSARATLASIAQDPHSSVDEVKAQFRHTWVKETAHFSGIEVEMDRWQRGDEDMAGLRVDFSKRTEAINMFTPRLQNLNAVITALTARGGFEQEVTALTGERDHIVARFRQLGWDPVARANTTPDYTPIPERVPLAYRERAQRYGLRVSLSQDGSPNYISEQGLRYMGTVTEGSGPNAETHDRVEHVVRHTHPDRGTPSQPNMPETMSYQGRTFDLSGDAPDLFHMLDAMWASREQPGENGVYRYREPGGPSNRGTIQYHFRAEGIGPDGTRTPIWVRVVMNGNDTQRVLSAYAITDARMNNMIIRDPNTRRINPEAGAPPPPAADTEDAAAAADETPAPTVRPLTDFYPNIPNDDPDRAIKAYNNYIDFLDYVATLAETDPAGFAAQQADLIRMLTANEMDAPHMVFGHHGFNGMSEAAVAANRLPFRGPYISTEVLAAQGYVGQLQLVQERLGTLISRMQNLAQLETLRPHQLAINSQLYSLQDRLRRAEKAEANFRQTCRMGGLDLDAPVTVTPVVEGEVEAPVRIPLLTPLQESLGHEAVLRVVPDASRKFYYIVTEGSITAKQIATVLKNPFLANAPDVRPVSAQASGLTLESGQRVFKVEARYVAHLVAPPPPPRTANLRIDNPVVSQRFYGSQSGTATLNQHLITQLGDPDYVRGVDYDGAADHYRITVSNTVGRNDVAQALDLSHRAVHPDRTANPPHGYTTYWVTARNVDPILLPQAQQASVQPAIETVATAAVERRMRNNGISDLDVVATQAGEVHIIAPPPEPLVTPIIAPAVVAPTVVPTPSAPAAAAAPAQPAEAGPSTSTVSVIRPEPFYINGRQTLQSISDYYWREHGMHISPRQIAEYSRNMRATSSGFISPDAPDAPINSTRVSTIWVPVPYEETTVRPPRPAAPPATTPPVPTTSSRPATPPPPVVTVAPTVVNTSTAYDLDAIAQSLGISPDQLHLDMNDNRQIYVLVEPDAVAEAASDQITDEEQARASFNDAEIEQQRAAEAARQAAAAAAANHNLDQIEANLTPEKRARLAKLTAALGNAIEYSNKNFSPLGTSIINFGLPTGVVDALKSPSASSAWSNTVMGGNAVVSVGKAIEAGVNGEWENVAPNLESAEYNMIFMLLRKYAGNLGEEVFRSLSQKFEAFAAIAGEADDAARLGNGVGQAAFAALGWGYTVMNLINTGAKYGYTSMEEGVQLALEALQRAVVGAGDVAAALVYEIITIFFPEVASHVVMPPLSQLSHGLYQLFMGDTTPSPAQPTRH
jgi:hypothetical protein